MIDPIIFTIRVGSMELPIRWYGVIIMTAVLVATWIAMREIKRRGEDTEFVWDAMVWVLIAGIIGARLWYVVNDILGGGSHFISDPTRIVMIPEGGLHIYGAILFGGLAAYVYARRHHIDIWLVLDSVAPALLIGQAIARPANYINQELYGPPTDLPWGIWIDSTHRIPPYNDLVTYPEATRFHPTFAYEMIWNILAASLLLWIGRRYANKIKPGTIFAGWLVLAGLGRFLIEFFRPDQPRIPGTPMSYTSIVAGLMSLVGGLWLLNRYGIIRIPFLGFGPDVYRVRTQEELAAAKGKRNVKAQNPKG
jgi:phosphatidylglycerol:prolipoprotein diacylglycerol transferase